QLLLCHDAKIVASVVRFPESGRDLIKRLLGGNFRIRLKNDAIDLRMDAALHRSGRQKDHVFKRPIAEQRIARLSLQYADYAERHALNGNRLADCRTASEYRIARTLGEYAYVLGFLIGFEKASFSKWTGPHGEPGGRRAEDKGALQFLVVFGCASDKEEWRHAGNGVQVGEPLQVAVG